jgi:hypothetical protein
MADERNASGADQESEEYRTLVLLDELESLLEDMEDEGITGLAASESIPADIKQRMDALGVHDVQQVRDRLMHLHAQVDEDDADLTITDS